MKYWSIIPLLILSICVSCTENEPNLPDETAFGVLTIEGIEYDVKYGMIHDWGLINSSLYGYSLALSDHPIGWDENGQFYSSAKPSFTIIVSFKTIDKKLKSNDYEFWLPEENPEPYWWNLDNLYAKNMSLNHPNTGKIVFSELDGTYSVLLNLNAEGDENFASIHGTIFGQLYF